MKQKFTWALIFISILFCSGTYAHDVVGYFAGWKWYKRNKLVNPESINYSNYTIINYAFFKPLDNGTITEGDAYADPLILLGSPVFKNGKDSGLRKSSLIQNAHSNNVKVIASIGGWNWSSVFPEIANDPDKRKKFALSCIRVIEKYNFDGIDIDWEYPGHKLHNGSPADKNNFTKLLKCIRDELNLYSEKKGVKLMLTAAIGAAPVHMDAINWPDIEPLLDMVNLMAYNYHGAWDNLSNHNTPLFPTKIGSDKYNVQASVNYLTKICNVPSQKINLGIAFYGRSVKMENESVLFGRTLKKADDIIFSNENGTPSYFNILKNADLFDKKWDNTSMVPYLTGKNGLKIFVSYDDPQSVYHKAWYALQNNLGGVVIWDISGDCVASSEGNKIVSNPLCDAIHNAFRNKTPLAQQNAPANSDYQTSNYVPSVLIRINCDNYFTLSP